MPGFDDLEIEVLADGTIKTSTSKVSSVNHAGAEAFLRFLSQMTGSEGKRVKRSDAQQHHHHHHAQEAKQ